MTLRVCRTMWLRCGMAVACAAITQDHVFGQGKPAAAPPPALPDVKTVAPPVVEEPIDAERAAALAQPHVAQPQLAKPAVKLPASFNFDQVYYDQPGDGSLWARGKTYKAQFSTEGFTYAPFLGSDAPKNYPIQMTLQGVDVGGEPLKLAQPVVSRDGNRVVIDRGAVQEVYLLTPESIEQEFVFNEKPGRGDVQIHLGVQTELVSGDADGMLKFSNDLGGVSYSKAVTVDAADQHTDSPTALIGSDAIRITVPAAALQTAAYPVTVDPIFTTFTVDFSSGSTQDNSPDVAYDASDDGYVITFVHDFSATDGDVYSERYDFNGDLIGGSVVTIDSSGDDWRNARVANNNLNNNHLVVAQVGAPGSRSIWGRTREASGNGASGQFQISDPGSAGDKVNPDVGGDPNLNAPVFYLVVWQRILSGSDHDIHGRLVVPNATLSGGTIFIDNSGSTVDITPNVSKTDGALSAPFQDWIVAWDRANVATNHDIYGARIHWDGSITSSTFSVDTSGVDNRNPAASTILDANQNYMVVYEEDPLGAGDLYARVFSGTLIADGNNLTIMENINTDEVRRRPAIDSTADHFIVVSGEQFFANDWDPYLSTYCFTGEIRVAEQHRNLDFDTLNSDGLQIASLHSAGGTLGPSEMMTVWANQGGSGFGAIHGAFVGAKSSCCLSDLNNSGTTDIDDLFFVIGGWGSCVDLSDCPFDVDGSLETDIDDLFLIIAGWGPCL